MAGIASVGSVGAGLNEAYFQVQYQTQVLKEQLSTSEDLGNAALKLIRTALGGVTQASNHDLDVLA